MNPIVMIKSGTPIRSPNKPKKCSETIRIIKVINTGIWTYDDTILGLR